MKKLLAIVDDWERMDRYEEKLSSQFEIITSPFGRIGIEMARREKPDVILVDLALEDMNELDAWKLIRDHATTATIPAFVLLSDPTQLPSSQCIKKDLDFFLNRAMKMEQIVSALTSI